MKRYPFAPGVIDASMRRTRVWHRLGRAGFLTVAVVVMGSMAMMALALLMMGLFHIELFEGARLL